MKASIRNIRGCERADLDWNGILLLAGLNGQGKSSILDAIRCAATGTLTPLDLAKKDLPAYITAGAVAGSITIAGKTGSYSLSYPEGTRSATGTPPSSNTLAIGLEDFCSLPMDERASALAAFLKSSPTRADFESACADLGLKPETVDALWGRIEVSGWDGAHEQAKEACTKLKGQWEKATGERYGSTKAAMWKPANWQPRWAEVSAEDIADDLANAGAAVEAAIGTAAVDAVEINRMRAELERFGAPAAIAVADALAEEERAQAAAQAAVAELAKHPAPPPTTGMACPHCGNKIHVRQTKPGEWLVEKMADIDPPTLKKLRMAFVTADGANAHAQDALSRARRITEIAGKLNTKLPAENAAKLTSARLLLERAEERAAAIGVWHEATALVGKVNLAAAVAELLSEKGLRRLKLLRALDTFNRHLENIADFAEVGWRAPAITEALGVTYGGRPYSLLSDSEQWRARAMLQIAFSDIDGSAVVCFDGADILHRDDRANFIAMLIEAQRRGGTPTDFVVAMTLSDRGSVPDLAEGKNGASVWVEKGVAYTISSEGT